MVTSHSLETASCQLRTGKSMFLADAFCSANCRKANSWPRARAILPNRSNLNNPPATTRSWHATMIRFLSARGNALVLLTFRRKRTFPTVSRAAYRPEARICSINFAGPIAGSVASSKAMIPPRHTCGSQASKSPVTPRNE